jgi:hypothetical protein
VTVKQNLELGQKFQTGTDLVAQLCCMLANAARKDERLPTSQRRCHFRNGFSHLIAEHSQRKIHLFVLAPRIQQLPDVAALP